MSRITYILATIAIFVAGYGTHSLFSSVDFIHYFSENIRLVILVSSVFLVTFGLTLFIAYLWLKRILIGSTGHALTEPEYVEEVIETITNPYKLQDPSNNDRMKGLASNGLLWFMRRSASNFYFNIVVTVVGGIVGIATLTLLSEQNKIIGIQNERLALQTDANITESVLLEGTRRASLSRDLFELLADIRTTVEEIDNNEENGHCPVSKIGNCWDWRSENKIVKTFPEWRALHGCLPRYSSTF